VFVLNPQSGVPIYRQLVEQVKRLIASGQLAAGEALPSVRDLAGLHAVNPMTISKAYALLEAEGLLERNRGKPMTVATRGGQGKLRERKAQLEAQVRELALAAHQLELDKADVISLINTHWEKTDG